MVEDVRRPINGNDRTGWRAYWASKGMPWRTEPEINKERQQFLAERLSITPSIERGVYPFRDEHASIKLARGDVEWMLTTNETRQRWEYGRTDIRWEYQQTQARLDLRGADLRGEDLSWLPLMAITGGVSHKVWPVANEVQRDMAAIRLEGANLNRAWLSGSALRYAHLEGADLGYAHLEGVTLRGAHLAGADLRHAYFDEATILGDTDFGDVKRGAAQVADLQWGQANLSVVDWVRFSMLGDELVAHARRTLDEKTKSRHQRREEFETAVRANNQLSMALHAQGVKSVADYFAYRTQSLQRYVLRYQGHWATAFGSWLLDIVAGYGYKPVRSIITYFVVIVGFAAAYLALSNQALTLFLPSHASRLVWYEALVLSVSSFHGRGLFPTSLSLSDPIAILAAFEAVIGLLIEIVFIATFTQRVFAR